MSSVPQGLFAHFALLLAAVSAQDVAGNVPSRLVAWGIPAMGKHLKCVGGYDWGLGPSKRAAGKGENEIERSAESPLARRDPLNLIQQ